MLSCDQFSNDAAHERVSLGRMDDSNISLSHFVGEGRGEGAASQDADLETTLTPILSLRPLRERKLSAVLRAPAKWGC